MASVSRTVMMAAEQREMLNIRREIDGMFKTCQGYVKDELDDISRKAQLIIHEARNSGNAEAIEHKEKLKEKIEEMKDTKGKVEAYLKNFKLKKPPADLQSQGSASKGNGNVNWEYQLKLKSPEMDKKLEKIVEDASMKSKEEEFNGLRNQLKMCLLCFSIFPMDAEIVKKVLIYWWIGEGFVTAKGEKTAEEVGEDCFKELVELEFIQPVYNRCRGNILRCRMDPWIRRMIIELSRNEQFFNLIESGMPSSSPSKSQHACLISKDEDGQLDEAYFLRAAEPSLRTLFNVNVTFLKLNFDVDCLWKLKSLVVLHLGNWRASETDSIHFIKIEETQTLDMLGDLVNLRYLSLRGISVITKLPSSIKALRNLEILDLKGCHNLEKLTDEIKWLKKLTHLDVSECFVLGYLPKELGSLSELEVIKGFVFGSYKSRNSCKVADLARLKKLRKLSINIWHGTEYVVDLHDLYKIKGLRSFAMAWSVPAYTSFSIPRTVVKLDLRCFPNSDPPPWLNGFHLANLEKLYIRGGKLETFHIPEEKQEEKVWNIKMLRLKFLKEMKLETVDIQERFPHLEYLEVYECPNINLSDESYKRDSDGVWVNEKLEVSPASSPARTTISASNDSRAAGTSSGGISAQESSSVPMAVSLTHASDASKEPSTVPEGTPTIPAATTIASDASHTDHASTLEPSPTPASAITPLSSPSSASPTTTQEHSPASPAHTNTQEASPAPATPTITPEASLTSPAPTTTPEASPASVTPTTTQEASPSSVAPNTAQEASPASAAPTTIQEASPASATPTAQEASPSSATPTA